VITLTASSQAQNAQIRAASVLIGLPPTPDHNGGSARGYLGRWRDLSVLYGLLDGRPFCIFMHRHPWGECPHLPLTERRLTPATTER
jgi:hypothetical protein